MPMVLAPHLAPGSTMHQIATLDASVSRMYSPASLRLGTMLPLTYRRMPVCLESTVSGDENLFQSTESGGRQYHYNCQWTSDNNNIDCWTLHVFWCILYSIYQFGVWYLEITWPRYSTSRNLHFDGLLFPEFPLADPDSQNIGSLQMF